ncbi:hypothetical protein BDQ17DRAFT_1431830 [Cyathus striatus]|nr:hypothetical protein BDQ17DRAFT_1431830 [Cyathus striatus]
MSSATGCYSAFIRAEAVRSLTLLANNVTIRNVLWSLPVAPESVESNMDVCLQWIRYFAVLTEHNGRNELQSLITIASEDSETLYTEAINTLISLVKKYDNVCSALAKSIRPQHLNIILAKNTTNKRALAWINLIALLPLNLQPGIIPTLEEATSHPDPDVWMAVIVSLLDIFVRYKYDATLKYMVEDILSTCIVLGLQSRDVDIRKRSIQAIKLVIDSVTVNEDNVSELYSIINTAVSPLIKIIMRDEGDMQYEAEIAFDRVKKVCEDNISKGKGIIHSALSTITTRLITITEKGSDFVLRLAQWLKHIHNLDPVTISSASGELVYTLRNLRDDSRLPRVTAVALLEQLCARYENECFPVISSNIQFFVSIILNDKLDNFRTAALKLVIFVLRHDCSTLSEIKRFKPQFMLLLEADNMKFVVAELLSLMAKDRNIRKSILTDIIRLGISQENQLFKGHITLLSRLLIDKRILNEPTDYVMILFAYTLVSHPRLEYLKFQVVSALWCYHKPIEKEIGRRGDQLRNEFQSALFGRHATSTEVEEWCAMSSSLLELSRPSTVRHPNDSAA